LSPLARVSVVNVALPETFKLGGSGSAAAEPEQDDSVAAKKPASATAVRRWRAVRSRHHIGANITQLKSGGLCTVQRSTIRP
jgi:hypothetical protein